MDIWLDMQQGKEEVEITYIHRPSTPKATAWIANKEQALQLRDELAAHKSTQATRRKKRGIHSAWGCDIMIEKWLFTPL